MKARIYKINEKNEKGKMIYETEIYGNADIKSIKKLKDILEKETKSNKYIATTIYEDSEWEIK